MCNILRGKQLLNESCNPEKIAICKYDSKLRNADLKTENRQSDPKTQQRNTATENSQSSRAINTQVTAFVFA